MDYRKGFASVVICVTPNKVTSYDDIHKRMMALRDTLGIDVYMGKLVVDQPMTHANMNVAYETFSNSDSSIVGILKYIEPPLHHFDDDKWSELVLHHAKNADALSQTLSNLIKGEAK